MLSGSVVPSPASLPFPAQPAPKSAKTIIKTSVIENISDRLIIGSFPPYKASAFGKTFRLYDIYLP
jgi:hypothetical protein